MLDPLGVSIAKGCVIWGMQMEVDVSGLGVGNGKEGDQSEMEYRAFARYKKDPCTCLSTPVQIRHVIVGGESHGLVMDSMRLFMSLSCDTSEGGHFVSNSLQL